MPVLNQEILISPELSHPCRVPSVIDFEIKPRDTLLNYAHGTANSVDPDQAVHRGLSDPGLHCLL